MCLVVFPARTLKGMGIENCFVVGRIALRYLIRMRWRHLGRALRVWRIVCLFGWQRGRRRRRGERKLQCRLCRNLKRRLRTVFTSVS